MTGFKRGALDSTLGVETPEGIEFILYPAGLAVRACAYVLDVLVQGVFIIVLLIIAGSLEDVIGIWLILFIIFGIDWFYHVAGELLFRGQSLGKRIMGLRVVRSNGSPVNPGASLLRNLLRFADTFMFFYPIALVGIAASRGFRRLGDWAADTLVVYTSRSPEPMRWYPRGRLPGEAVISPGRPLSYEEKQALLSFARRYPLLGKARADEIARPYAAVLREAGQVPGTSPEIFPAEKSPPILEGDLSDGEYLLGIARKFGRNVL
ncbi:MAG: RDD family protein [Treponema sp.]|jgi:uncharacterized RDD family membrane protein YckC|nr:RDD family protein [Treponema sp.]